MKDIDPGYVGRRLVMNGSDDLWEQVAGGRWTWQSVGEDLDGAFSFKGQVGYCKKSACLSSALYGCTY